MSIQWFPGHMTKARREIAEFMKEQDVIIEVLDARMPRASENPLLATLRRGKPCIKVLSKSDLADPAVTAAWLRYFEERGREPTEARPEGTVVAIALSTEKLADIRKRLPDLCTKVAGPRSGKRALHAMIVGIPNVGKSTLVNTLMGRKVAVAADKPAVTKQQQFVVLANGIALRDNPGILWPKLEDPRAALRLALAGAIPESAADPYEVALFAAETLMADYPAVLLQRYKLEALPETPEAMIEAIGRKRGKLRAGGIVDVSAAAAELIHAFRTGALGPMSLEAPDDATV